jgi:hypothetical protein
LPSQTAHRVVLPSRRLSELLGIVAPLDIVVAVRSSFFHRRASSAVHFSNACSLRRSRAAAQLHVGNRRASKGVTERYEGLWRSPLELTTSARGQSLQFGSPKAMSDSPLEAGYRVAQRVPVRVRSMRYLMASVCCPAMTAAIQVHSRVQRRSRKLVFNNWRLLHALIRARLAG